MKKLLLITFIAFAFLLFLPKAFAQTSQNSGESQLYNAANGTNNAPVNKSNSSNNGDGITYSGATTDNINYLWLLPLLAIPIIFLIFRIGENTGQNINNRYYSQIAGAKGGKTVRKKKASGKKANL